MISFISYCKLVLSDSGVDTSGFSLLTSGIDTVRASKSMITILEVSISESITNDVTAPHKYGKGASITFINRFGNNGTNVFTKFNGRINLLKNSQQGDIIEACCEINKTILSNNIDSHPNTNICGVSIERGTILISLSSTCSDELNARFNDPELNFNMYDSPQVGNIGVSHNVSNRAFIDVVNSEFRRLVS